MRVTAAIDASASPRNPIVVMARRSSVFDIFEVAWRKTDNWASSMFMPMPLSVTERRFRPASSTSMKISSAPASNEFSTNSLMALDALSSTSPADIWSLSALDNTRIWDSDMIRTRLYLVVLLYDVGHLELIFVGHLDSEGRRALDRDISKANRWQIDGILPSVYSIAESRRIKTIKYLYHL